MTDLDAILRDAHETRSSAGDHTHAHTCTHKGLDTCTHTYMHTHALANRDTLFGIKCGSHRVRNKEPSVKKKIKTLVRKGINKLMIKWE